MAVAVGPGPLGAWAVREGSGKVHLLVDRQGAEMTRCGRKVGARWERQHWPGLPDGCRSCARTIRD